MIAPFGPRSEAYVRGLAHLELEAIVTDVEYLPQAYVAAMERRVTGRPFYGMILFQDVPSRFTMLNVAAVSAQVATFDERRLAFDQLAQGTMKTGEGLTVADGWREFEASAGTYVGEFAAICDALLVRSCAEYVRLTAFCKRPRNVELVVARVPLPAVERRVPERPGVVVWAPEFTSAEIMFHAFALEEFHGDVVCVTSDGGAPAPARFLTSADPRLTAALAGATAILCVDPDDPGPAAAFAALGYGVAAPLTAGAYEFVRGVVSFDLQKRDSIYAAVQIALAQPASVRALPQAPRVPERPTLPPAESLPLVSVVLCTYNRREDVTRALTCLQRQTYPNIEVVVVNDAGENVDDVIARFPQARPHNIPVNGGVLKAIGEGLRRARGEYVQVLADDDWLEPDHVEALVGAMLGSGAWIAHANTLIRHQELVPGAEPKTIGFNAIVFNESTTPTDALIATPIAGHSIIFRRDMLDRIGTWREDCILADQEFQLRAAGKYVLVYVDRITAEWRSRGSDNLSTVTDSSVELRRIYEKLHPIEGRPHLQHRREEALARVGSRTKGVFAFRPTLTVES